MRLKVEIENATDNDIRDVAKKALLKLLEPIAGFVSDSGLSTGEVHAIFKEAAVRNAAAKQLENSGRVNISGIAAITGISRAEISRILRLPVSTAKNKKKSADSQLQSTNKILTAWHIDPKFNGITGEPADLNIYGRGHTFESLAKRHGRGIPTRAMLDELLRYGAVEVLPNQKLRAKASMTVERGVSVQVVKAFGDRASELLSTMLHNMRWPESAKFLATVSGTVIVHKTLPLIRKQVSSKGADFLADVQENLLPKRNTSFTTVLKENCAQVSVTIYYHDSLGAQNANSKTVAKRRNYRRRG